jgi:chromosome partitioning protein
MKTIVFFNNKGGVGKTSLVYHIGWMFAELGLNVVMADIDPQANLTSMSISEAQLEEIWNKSPRPTIYSTVAPLLVRGTGDIMDKTPCHKLSESLFLIIGDLALANVEDELSKRWPECLDAKEAAFRVTTAFDRAIRNAARRFNADVVLVDIGPNLGAINRCALIASDLVVVPMAPDLFSIQGLENMGPKLREWRDQWGERRAKAPKDMGFPLAPGQMEPIGYVVSRHSVLAGGAVKAFQRWLDKAPETYARCVLDQSPDPDITVETDTNRLAQLKDYRSLMPMAQERRKPIFKLKAGDGAIGGHQEAVADAYKDFEKLAKKICRRASIPLPTTS